MVGLLSLVFFQMELGKKKKLLNKQVTNYISSPKGKRWCSGAH